MFVADFFEMEEKCNLFDLKSNEGFPLWDIIRFEVYGKYTSFEASHISRNKFLLLLISVVGMVKVFFSFFSFLFRKAPILIFPNSRYLDENEKLFDKSCENVIGHIKEKYIIVERFKALKKYRYPVEYNYVLFYKSIASSKCSLPDVIVDQIINSLIGYLGEAKITKDEINKIYRNFIKEYSYYRFLFKLKRARKVYFVLNGIQKGMIAAAHSLNMEIHEFQHGKIDKAHLAYSYPISISRGSQTISPDVFYTMGSLWGKGLNIPTEIIPLGNDYFAISAHSNVEKDNSLLFISSFLHESYLSALAIDFIEKFPSVKIKYKLHPGEYRDVKKYEKRFSAYSNISVLKNEISISELISKATIVVLIDSTALHETLNQGGKVAIYKRFNYELNVYLIDNVDDLKKAYDAPTIDSKEIFFDKFDLSKLK